MRIVWTRVAINDLVEAREYIAEDDPKAAARVATRVLEAVRALSESPQLGHVGAVRSTREWHVGHTPYRLIYRFSPPRLEILRVLHDRRQWPTHASDAKRAVRKVGP